MFESNPAKGLALEGAIKYTKDCWDDLFTFIDNGYVQTCKINNINVERYFKYVLENIHCESVDSLLPYSNEIKEKI